MSKLNLSTCLRGLAICLVALWILRGYLELSSNVVATHASSENEFPSAKLQTIETIRLGQRIVVRGPDPQSTTYSSRTTDWPQWMQVDLLLPLGSGARSNQPMKVSLLRPESWLVENLRLKNEHNDRSVPIVSDLYDDEPVSPIRPIYRCLSGLLASFDSELDDQLQLQLWIDLPEMQIQGWANVIDLAPAPNQLHGQTESANGQSEVVTATFQHLADNICDVVLEGEPQPVGVTSHHLFWSPQQQRFVPIGDLKEGDLVQTFHGETKRIVQKLARPGPQTVFNLEVNGQHVYHVGQSGFLVHNSCARPTWQESEKDIGDALGWKREPSYKLTRFLGFITGRYPQGSVRPDLKHPDVDLFVDIKNYELSSPRGRMRLYLNSWYQSLTRETNLPEGSVQGLILDIRGQTLSSEILARVKQRIERITKGRIKAVNVQYWDNNSF